MTQNDERIRSTLDRVVITFTARPGSAQDTYHARALPNTQPMRATTGHAWGDEGRDTESECCGNHECPFW